MTPKRWTLAAVLIALALCMLVFPFVRRLDLDDWVHYAVLEGTLGRTQGVLASGPWDLFRFSDGTELANLRFREAGKLWFAPDNWKLAFWRPLSSLLTALDHQCFGLWAPGYFVHSALWYLGVCWVVAGLFQRLLPTREAGIAGVLFAMLGTHYQPVMWASSRNALLCAFFGFSALFLHLRFRREGWRPGKWLAVLCAALALASGEAGLGALAFLLSYELFGARDALPSRLRSVAPVACMSIVWLGVYIYLGYGTQGSSEYLNPVGLPLAFLQSFPLRLANGAAVLLLGAPADLWLMARGSRLPLGIAGLLGSVGCFVLLRRAMRGLQETVRSQVVWLAAGTFLALVPQLAGAMGPRSYLIPSLGACGLVAVLVTRHWNTSTSGRLFAGALLLVHGALGVAGWATVAYVADQFRLRADREFEEMGLARPESTERSYFVITTSDGFSSWYVPYRMAALHGKLGHQVIASMALCDHTLRRLGERSFELSLAGTLFAEPFVGVLADVDSPPAVGHTVELSDTRFEVLGVNEDRQPNRFAVTFKGNKPLPEMWAWHEGKHIRVELPAIGESKTFKWVAP
jgi:hypothetical protein